MKNQRNQSYASALSQVVPGKGICLPNVSKLGVLGIHLRGIPEVKCGMTDDSLKSNLKSVRSVLKYLAVESKVTRLKRIGLHDNYSKNPRTIIFLLKDEIDRDLRRLQTEVLHRRGRFRSSCPGVYQRRSQYRS